MSRKNFPSIIEDVEIIDTGAEGKGVAKKDEWVLFVQGAVPGDIVDVTVTGKKKNLIEGCVAVIKQYSPKRTEPVCQHFGVCGGCKWQQLQYKYQLEYKQKQVTDALQRIGKIELPFISPIIASVKEYHYRNKLDYTFSNKRWLTTEDMAIAAEIQDTKGLGFHIPGRFDKIVNVEECHLQPQPSNAIRLEVRKYALEHNLPFFDLKTQQGLLRNLIIRNSVNGQWMVIVAFAYEDENAINGLLEHIKKTFPEITALLYVVNSKRNETFHDLEVKIFSGQGFLIEEMEGLKFKVGPKSFYQTNSYQAYELYKVTRDFAALTGDEIVYDLYTGTGTIANFVAKQAKKVVGVEFVPDAIEDAKENSRLNNITNTQFYAGDMKDILIETFIAENGHPDVIITDPPRAGMHENVVKTILQLAPERVVYVSCNPATQARDLQLMDAKYSVTKVQPVDMFPHTYHVENVVLLEKRFS